MIVKQVNFLMQQSLKCIHKHGYVTHVQLYKISLKCLTFKAQLQLEGTSHVAESKASCEDVEGLVCTTYIKNQNEITFWRYICGTAAEMISEVLCTF